MTQKEITIDINLNDKETKKVELHSFINVINVIYGELQILEGILEKKGAFNHYLHTCKSLIKTFSTEEDFSVQISTVENFKQSLLTELKGLIEEVVAEKPAKKLAAEELYKSLESIMDIVDVRVKELLARAETQGSWEKFTCETVRQSLQDVMTTIAQNSMGRFGIVFTEERKSPRDYFIDIRVNGRNGKTILLPPVILDSFRDITANARKYSKPGSSITAQLSDDGENIIMTVSDPGRGIPGDEIEEVVKYGIRGSNTDEKETKGGGFGLTKAYFITKQYGGRMWIQSELQQGTTVKIVIPKPRS
jgi:signal transduction histidine kinase